MSCVIDIIIHILLNIMCGESYQLAGMISIYYNISSNNYYLLPLKYSISSNNETDIKQPDT